MSEPCDLQHAINRCKAAANALKVARGCNDGTCRAKHRALVRAVLDQLRAELALRADRMRGAM